MPIYIYGPSGDEHCRYCMNTFERRQKLADARIGRCPECGSRVRRVISAPNLTRPTPSMTEQNIGDKGFTQYKKLEKGVYEKTVGKGPDIISDKE